MSTVEEIQTAQVVKVEQPSGLVGWLTGSPWWIVGLHGVVLLFSAPVLALYFSDLWEQPHYRFFPFVLFFVAFYVAVRIGEMSKVEVAANGVIANLLLLLSVPFFLFGNMVFDQFTVAYGCFFVAASLLARVRDANTHESLLPAAVVLLIILRPPFEIDIKMITILQFLTSSISSRILDLVGVYHNLDGNTINVSGKEFFVEEACSGVQSLFTLLFCALAWAVFTRKTWLRMLLLVFAAIFWAAFSNTIRVLSICIAHAWWNIDLATGTPHMIIGYTALSLGIFLLWSTDFFLTYLFGHSLSAEIQDRNWFQKLTSTVNPSERRRRTSAAPLAVLMASVFIVGICAMLTLVSFVPLARLGPGRIVKYIVQPFLLYEITAQAVADVDEKIAIPYRDPKAPAATDITWNIGNFATEQRERNSDWGTRTSRWQLLGSNFNFVFSCDYPFGGWHELSVCYRGNGWKMKTREVITDFDQSGWSFVESEFTKSSGETGYLLFSLFDANGEPVSVPESDILKLGYAGRIINAVSNRVKRDYGPRPQTFQVQCWVPTYGSLSDLQKQELKATFVYLRDRVRDHVLEQEKAVGEPATKNSTTRRSVLINAM